jgi:hypothetical protein
MPARTATVTPAAARMAIVGTPLRRESGASGSLDGGNVTAHRLAFRAPDQRRRIGSRSPVTTRSWFASWCARPTQSFLVSGQVRSPQHRFHRSWSGRAFRGFGRNLGDHLLPVRHSPCPQVLAAAAGSFVVLLAVLIAGLPRSVVPAAHRAAARASAGRWRRGRAGTLPSGPEGGLELVAHPVRGVGVQAAHPGDPVPEPLLGEGLRDGIFGEKGWLPACGPSSLSAREGQASRSRGARAKASSR